VADGDETEAIGAEVGTPPQLAETPAPTLDVPSPPRLSQGATTFDDTARFWLAIIFTAIFGATLLFAFGAVLLDSNTWANIKELLAVVMPAETALLGAATGFYFGAKK
jgi:hypothetical protein